MTGQYVRILGILGVACGVAAAAPLQLNPAADLYKQTEASPCIFGGSNCQNPVGWSMSATDTGNTGAYAATHTYTGATYSVFLDAATTEFIVGIDLNDTGAAQVLNSFTISFNDGTVYSFAGPTNIPSLANGVGWSDYTLTLAGGSNIAVPEAATEVTFSVSAVLNDGPDRFFVIGQGQSAPPEVPEPATFGLLAAGLTAMGALRLRKRH